ncbi:hypothetical protein GQX73_g10901 [Xylaria multiplex]|uniref:Protein kinase domain-containing protein n=1 Tax=Xylaria multiplex TaxID=323545 RepID=A0A7C8MET3_9PEZI|nr:hypothetical protein GQX73_g10901 [Xylaria multiplex]
MSSGIATSVEQLHTPYPYHAGQRIPLRDSNGVEFLVDIVHEYPFTISPAVVVNLHKDGVVQEAVLKLYDRRFGELRKRRLPSGKKQPQPHTKESEAAFQDYARSGKLIPVFNRLKHVDLMYDLHREVIPPPDPEEEEKRPERERLAEEEATFYYNIQKRYTDEVRVYDKLKHLQGRGIPRFFTTVTLHMPSPPPDLEPSYFQVPGILIERLHGFNLSDLVTEMPEGPHEVWADIIQKAIDLAVEINRAGVLDGDSQPRNAIVTRREDNTYEVRRIDFGEADLESDLTYYREHEPDLFKQTAMTAGNPDALGGVMVSKVKRLTGVKLDVVYNEPFPESGGLPIPEGIY